jgi:glycosyltransferase involved in cell wall biosynthesis
MKNIAIIISDITKSAGTERAVCNLTNLLVQSGNYTPIIISLCSKDGFPKYTLQSGIIIHHFNFAGYKKKIIWIFEYILLLKKIKTFCVHKNIDILLGTNHGMNIGICLLSSYKLKTVVCEHMNYSAAPMLSRFIRRLTYPLCNAIVVLTTSDSKHYSFHKNIKIIPNSLSFISEKRANLNNKRILAVGRLTYQKGFDRLIDAISLIREQCEGWEIKIIGSGEDEPALKKQIGDLELNHLINIYPATTEILYEYINASILVVSSHWEGFSMVLIEAKSCGLPAVSFNCPEGPSEIIKHDEDGLLVENGNTKDLSKAIASLISDPQKRFVFGMNALKNIDRYKPEYVFHLWNNLFESL